MNVATYVGGLIQAKAYRVLRAHVYACLETYQLNPTSWSLLGLIHQAPKGIRLADAAREIGVKAPLVTAIADELTARKLIKRVPDTRDQRAKLLVMTRAGVKLMGEVEAALAQRLEDLLEGVSQDELKTYHKVLRTIIDNDERLSAWLSL